MSQRIAVFPGSFDPVTIGHADIVQRAVPLFDKLIVAMGVNTTKKYMFTFDQRTAWLQQAFAQFASVQVVHYEGLTVDLCKQVGASFIVRGLRNGTDHDHERTIALMNMKLANVETVFLPAAPEHAHVSSTIVRELHANKADISAFVPIGMRIA
ncbi:MAG: pantetheine-phosphate adenylyltransferase [Flavobacteriales bacterium]|nr:pantetheine-phosphate adenylyltransferase [Flavobacteriales bacterium]MBK9194086.1 pantetheine-phosphate adenylyltransferase [Flavobacteriales bacterium]MBP6574820.1 pantetheine-phosphate adenylyltransferase [Flavobacteriales bacterium]